MLKSIYKIFFLLFFLCCAGFPAAAEEYIEKFTSDITVTPEGRLNVVEKITVHHEGNKVKRGIYRDFSTLKGERYEILDVLRNDQPEPWFTERKPDALRLNTGNDDFLPSPATSTYTINYIIYDVLREIKDENLNELYLNINGKWDMPIQEISAVVHYPANTNIVRQYAYQTGFEPKQLTPDTPFILKNLYPNDELTIAQAFTKGTVNIPVPLIWQFLGFAFGITLVYYLLAWLIWGKDPKPHAIVPDWEAPKDLTPLEVAYIDNNGEEPKNGFFLHILWLLHKRAIKIMQTDAPTSLFGNKKWYTLTTQPEADKTDKEVNRYCTQYPNVLTLTGVPSQQIAGYMEKLKKTTTNHLEKHYYRKRSLLTFFGALIVPMVWLYLFPAKFVYLIWLSFLAFIVISSFIKKQILSGIMALICTIPLVVAELNNLNAVIALGAYIAIVLLFKFLLFQPTPLGQHKKEKIEGLKMFLKTINANGSGSSAEKSAIGLSTDKRLTPIDMEALFPYAVALGLEKAWSKKFMAVFGPETYKMMTTAPIYNQPFRTALDNSCTAAAQHPKQSAPGTASHGGGFAGGGFGGGGGGGR